MLSKVYVEPDSQEDEQEDRQRRLPGRVVVSLRTRQLDHFLDDAGELQSAGRHSSHPSEATKPANDVRQRLLHGSRGEFADEVVLASGSRRHRGQLTHRGDHEHHEQPDCDHGVDDACGAAIEQAEVAGEQSVLPRRLQDRNEADDADELEVALRRVSMQFAPSGICWSYAELLGLAHSRHFALIFRGAALRLDGSLVQLHLLERRVVLRRPGFWD